MKKIFLLSCLSLLLSASSLSQQKVATYSIEINKKKVIDFLTSNNLDINTQRITLLMIDAANNSELELMFDEKNSFTQLEENLTLNDSNIPLAKGILTFINIAFPIYYDSMIKYFFEKRGGEDFPHLIKKNPINFNWKINDNRKKVGNLLYYQATSEFSIGETNYYVKAWFCPTIPVPFGPGYFQGLPGLITEVDVTSENSEFDYQLILNDIKTQQTNILLTPPLQYLDVLSFDESEKLYEKANNNLKN